MPDPERLRRVQLVRKAVLLAAIIAALVVAALTRSLHGAEDFHETWEAVGLALIVVCIVGRAWCSLYIGGRKKAEIVDRGPYSVSRNPLYLFSFMGAFGLGAQTGSFTLAAAFLVLTVAVFYVTVRREEDWLAAAFGESYLAYKARTPRFLPDFRLWLDAETLTIRPSFFLITLRDGLVFLLAVPLFEGLERLQASGWLPTLFALP